MSSYPVKVGEEVVVVAGGSKVGNKNDKPSSGKVTSINRTKNTITVEGVNLQKKAVKPSEDRPNGGFIEKEGPISVSNVVSKVTFDAKQAKKAN